MNLVDIKEKGRNDPRETCEVRIFDCPGDDPRFLLMGLDDGGFKFNWHTARTMEEADDLGFHLLGVA